MNTLKSILIGTRGSKLALWQSNIVKQAIEEKFPNISVRLEIIQTTGDKILDVALSKIGDKNLFTKEIEQAMLENRVDIAVHSLKDLPTELPQGLCIGAVLPRAECRDALVSNNGIQLHELNSNHIIGTSSLRRKAQLLAYNPHLHIEDVRGNIDTRLQKLASGQYDALIMAAAGLQRLGYEDYITEIIDPIVMLPAASQGIIGVECREADVEVCEVLQAIHDDYTWNMALAERTFLKQMNGGCQLPLGCFTQVNNSTIEINATILSVDGTKKLQFSQSGHITKAETLAMQLAQTFYDAGAQDILNEIR